jgi:hypothetical protein
MKSKSKSIKSFISKHPPRLKKEREKTFKISLESAGWLQKCSGSPFKECLCKPGSY